jgi:hypothetical protein
MYHQPGFGYHHVVEPLASRSCAGRESIEQVIPRWDGFTTRINSSQGKAAPTKPMPSVNPPVTRLLGAKIRHLLWRVAIEQTGDGRTPAIALAVLSHRKTLRKLPHKLGVASFNNRFARGSLLQRGPPDKAYQGSINPLETKYLPVLR